MVVVGHNIAEDTVLNNFPCLENYIFLSNEICENSVSLCILMSYNNNNGIFFYKNHLAAVSYKDIKLCHDFSQCNIHSMHTHTTTDYDA